MKKLLVVVMALLLASPVMAGEIFLSYQGTGQMPEDDNFGYGKGFFGQAVELGYSWKYVAIGTEYYVYKPVTLWGSNFLDNSILSTIKIQYPLPWGITPYGVVGVGTHIYTNKDFKTDPHQPASPWNTPETLTRTFGLGMKYGGGVEYRVKDFAIFGEVAYRYGDTGSRRGQPWTSSMAVYGWSYGGGVRWYF